MEVTVSVDMQTAGLLVLADRWDRGWRPYSDGNELPILRANYVLRGVPVPPGISTTVFRYEPQSFVWGVRLFLAGASILVVWLILVYRSRGRVHRADSDVALSK
jgi:uncharacterized membrane protein YfhO